MTDPKEANQSKELDLEELTSIDGAARFGGVVCPSVASDKKLPQARLTSNEPTIKLNNRTKNAKSGGIPGIHGPNT